MIGFIAFSLVCWLYCDHFLRLGGLHGIFNFRVFDQYVDMVIKPPFAIVSQMHVYKLEVFKYLSKDS